MSVLSKNKYFKISFGILLITFITNLFSRGFNQISQMNVYDTFFRFVVEEGGYTDIAVVLAAVIPVLGSNVAKTNNIDTVFDSFISVYLPKAFRIGIVFLVANTFAFLICLLFSSGSAIFTGSGYGYLGTFGVTRRDNPIIYIILYMINCSIFGSLMNVFSQAISNIVKRKHVVIVICILYYFSYLFLPVKWDIYSIVACLFPGIFYSFLNYDLSVGQRLLGFTIMILISFILFYIPQFKKGSEDIDKQKFKV